MKSLRYLIFFTVGILWVSCNDDQFRCDQGETFHFIENAEFQIDTSDLVAHKPELITGEQIAFRYEKWNDCENVFDDEVYEMMVFSLPQSNDAFLLDSPEEFSEVYAYFYRTGAWFEFLVPVTEGSISGVQTSSDGWELKVDVTIRWDNPDQNIYREIKFNRRFNKD